MILKKNRLLTNGIQKLLKCSLQLLRLWKFSKVKIKIMKSKMPSIQYFLSLEYTRDEVKKILNSYINNKCKKEKNLIRLTDEIL